jgi:methionyl-tRNA formyltransferase
MSPKKYNIIFMGTPEIAVPTLEALHNKYELTAVVTVPDKPQGRGMKLLSSPIKIKAVELGLPVLQPNDLKDINFIANIKKLNPDIIVVFAFKFLPKEVYEIAKITAFNIHTSLLPEYKGAAPINWVIINGESKTGLTSFILEDKIDSGSIIMQEEIIIPYNATAGELHNIMMEKAPDFTIKTYEKLLLGKYTLTPQTNKFKFSAPKLFKENIEISWKMDASSIVNFINGCSPIPCAWTMWDNKKMQILKAIIPTEKDIEKNIDNIVKLKYQGDFCISNEKLFVNCGTGILELVEIKLENKKTMLVKDFVNGYRGNLSGTFMNKSSE